MSGDVAHTSVASLTLCQVLSGGVRLSVEGGAQMLSTCAGQYLCVYTPSQEVMSHQFTGLDHSHPPPPCLLSGTRALSTLASTGEGEGEM